MYFEGAVLQGTHPKRIFLQNGGTNVRIALGGEYLEPTPNAERIYSKLWRQENLKFSEIRSNLGM